MKDYLPTGASAGLLAGGALLVLVSLALSFMYGDFSATRLGLAALTLLGAALAGIGAWVWRKPSDVPQDPLLEPLQREQINTGDKELRRQKVEDEVCRQLSQMTSYEATARLLGLTLEEQSVGIILPGFDGTEFQELPEKTFSEMNSRPSRANRQVQVRQDVLDITRKSAEEPDGVVLARVDHYLASDLKSAILRSTDLVHFLTVTDFNFAELNLLGGKLPLFPKQNSDKAGATEGADHVISIGLHSNLVSQAVLLGSYLTVTRKENQRKKQNPVDWQLDRSDTEENIIDSKSDGESYGIVFRTVAGGCPVTVVGGVGGIGTARLGDLLMQRSLQGQDLGEIVQEALDQMPKSTGSHDELFVFKVPPRGDRETGAWWSLEKRVLLPRRTENTTLRELLLEVGSNGAD